MKRRFFTVLVCLILTVLLAAAALTGCAKKNPSTAAQNAAAGETAGERQLTVEQLPAELGEGPVTFTFSVTTSSGKTASCQIHTAEDTVGDALQALKLIDGDESEFGLYVKTVCGETLDYETNGMYWAFYVNGSYAEKGVDQTPIVEGATYSLEATQG